MKLIPKFKQGSYVVKKGDNLTKIARRFDMSLQELLDNNKDIKNPDLIHIGDKINVDIKDTYKVKRGDNLTRIAKNHGLSLKELLKLNPQIKNKDLIYPGDIINLVDNSDKVSDTPPKKEKENKKEVEQVRLTPNEPTDSSKVNVEQVRLTPNEPTDSSKVNVEVSEEPKQTLEVEQVSDTPKKGYSKDPFITPLFIEYEKDEPHLHELLNIIEQAYAGSPVVPYAANEDLINAYHNNRYTRVYTEPVVFTNYGNILTPNPYNVVKYFPDSRYMGNLIDEHILYGKTNEFLNSVLANLILKPYVYDKQPTLEDF